MTGLQDTIPDGFEPVFHMGFNARVGPVLRRLETNTKGEQYIFDVRPEHLNGAGFVHGGMLMALCDIILGRTVSLAAGMRCTTVSLNCDFLAPGKRGDRIEGTAAVTRKTRSVVFVSGHLVVNRPDEDESLLMTATGVWKILNDKTAAP